MKKATTKTKSNQPEKRESIYNDVLKTCRKLLENNLGMATPFNEFVTDILMRAHASGPLTPADVKKLLDTFEEDHEYMRNAVINFTINYGAPVSKLPAVKTATAAAA